MNQSTVIIDGNAIQQMIYQNNVMLQQYHNLVQQNVSMLQYLSGQAVSASPSMYLDNCTDVAFNVPEGGNPMAYKRVRLPVGIDSQGNPVFKQIGGMSEQERWMNGLQAAIESGRIFDLLPAWAMNQIMPEVGKVAAATKAVTIGDVTIKYLESYYVGKNKDYAYQDRKRLERVLEFFGEDRAIDKFTVIDIQTFLDRRAESGISYTTIGDDKRVIRQLFDYAVDAKYIQPNAINFRCVRNNGEKKKTRKAVTVEQYADIQRNIVNIKNPIRRLCVAILTYTGMRPEELLGLQWEDIDWAQRRINIQRTITYQAEKRDSHEGGTKTEASRDWVPIRDGLWEHLAEHRGESGWIVHNKTGQPFPRYKSWLTFWNRVHKEINLYGLRPCEFRKTVATVLIARGADPKSVQRLLRHTNLDMTLNTYAEYDPDAFAASCSLLDML